MTELIVGMLFGMVITALILRIMLAMAMRRAQGELDDLITVMQNLQQQMIMCRVEEHDGMYYVYNTQDQSFVAQGRTVAELRDAIDGRWHNKQVLVTEGDRAIVEALKATETK